MSTTKDVLYHQRWETAVERVSTTAPTSAASRLALGAAISVLLVTRNPRHESHQAAGMPRSRPAAFLARIIVPHPE